MPASMPEKPLCDTCPMDVVGVFEGSSSTIVFDDGDEITARELAEQGRAVGGAWRAVGVAEGDRIALRMPNQADYVLALLGCASIGAVAVSVNTRYSDAEAGELVERSGAGLVVRGGDLPDAADGRASGSRRDDPFVVFTTSGTTSRPKMVVHRQRSIVDHASDVVTAFGYAPDDVIMVAMPLCGTFGLASLFAAVASGARVVVSDYETDQVARTIERERVTCLNGSDDMFHRLLEHGADLSSIRLGGYARFNTSLDGIVARAEAAGATLVGLYGMSEVQALFSVRPTDAAVADRERAGGRLSSPQAAYRIVDGELQLRGPSLFDGYLAEGGDGVDQALTAGAFDDGWFRTGDLASVDDDRTFEYLARMGDVLRLGGFLVSPAEIEAALMEVPGVTAAQVVAIERPNGARPVAFVLTRDGSPVDEPTAITHCRERLAIYKVPVRVVTVDEFPTTPSANGTKIQKTKLRDLAQTLPLASR